MIVTNHAIVCVRACNNVFDMIDSILVRQQREKIEKKFGATKANGIKIYADVFMILAHVRISDWFDI